jgi:YVTN family beta-propeller protein
MKTVAGPIRRPLRRAPFTLLLCIAALWAMLKQARALLLYVGQFTRSAIESRPAALSGLFNPNRKPAKSEMSVELGMIPVLLDRMASLLRVLSAGALLGCATAVANPISVSGLNLLRDYIGPNDLVFLPMGDDIELSASVTPNGSAGTTVTAQTTDLSTGLLTSPIVIPFGPSTVLPNFFITDIPYQSNLTGPWTVTFTNDVNTANTTTLITPSIVGVAPAPTPINVTESGSSLNPTFTWSYPTSVDSVTVLIFEKNIHVDPTGNLVPGGFDLVFGQSLPGATNSFTLPTVLAGGFTLTPGISYVVDLFSNILRNPTGPSTGANIEAATHTFFDFTPTSTAPLPLAIYLPTIGPNGVYNFNLTVQPNATYNIDPTVATGFTYTIGSGNPNFATVVLPALQGSEPYTITWDNGLHARQVPGGEIFSFLLTDPLGVSTFTVTGIDPADGVDPRSGTGFVTGLTFVAGGSFTGTMTPITTVPDVYITNLRSNTVSVINPSTNTVVATVPVGRDPAETVLTPNGTTAYVLNTGAGTVSVVNTSTNSVKATLRVGLLPGHAAVTPDGSSLYVTNTGSNNVSVISTATQSVVATIPVGLAPVGIAITPDGTRAYVTNAGSENVSVINTATHTVSAVVGVGAFPLTLAITPDGSSVYVANLGSNSVSVINTGTNRVETTVRVGFDPVDVAITPNGATAYIADALADSVTVLNTTTNQVVTTLPVGFLPVKTAITPNGATAYVADAGGKSVSAINTATNTVIATIGVGAEPVDVLISPDGVHAYVTDAGSNSVSVIDTSTNAVSATVPVGVRPVNAAIF